MHLHFERLGMDSITIIGQSRLPPRPKHLYLPISIALSDVFTQASEIGFQFFSVFFSNN